jgi:hypothetical protein
MSSPDPHSHHPHDPSPAHWLIAGIRRVLLAIGSLSRSTSVIIMAIVILAESALIVHRRNVELEAGRLTRTVDLTAEFPTGRTGNKEPLLLIKGAAGSVVVFADYLGSGRLRIGICDRQGHALQSSAVLEPAAGPHSLKVSAARGAAPSQALSLVVSMDGATLFASEAAPEDTGSLEFIPGRNPDSVAGIAAAFTGSVVAQWPIRP